MHQKVVPVPFLIFVNNPKQPLYARNSYKNKIFWKRIIKMSLKSWFYFFFQIQSLLMDKVIKNKRGLKLMNSRSSGYKTSSKNSFISHILSDQVWWYNIKIHDIINYSTSICPFEFGKCGKEAEKLQKFEYLENEKSFLDDIKNIFHSFWRVIIWWKNKKFDKK